MARRTINDVDLSRVFYDESSPSCVSWKATVMLNRLVVVSAGQPVGSVGAGGYYRTRILGVDVAVHELVLLLHGVDVTGSVDHIDGNILNNRLSNLRVVSHQLNCRNRKIRSDNKTGKTGVTDVCAESRFRVYWTSCGRVRSKSFKYDPTSKNSVFCVAAGYRDAMIARENANGAGYTHRHGT